MNPSQDLASIVLKLADRQAIHDQVLNYCRAVDRLGRELDGDTAHAETYWMIASMNISEPPLSFGGGRYIDRFERRDGRWAIAVRKCLIDWGGQPGASPMPQSALDAFLATGVPRRDGSDPSYQRPLQVDAARVGYLYQGSIA